MPSELLSHRLVSFRDRHGLTQAELAQLLGVTPRYLIYLENGTKDVGPESSLYKLFVAYEAGQVPLDRHLGANHKAVVREEAGSYQVKGAAALNNKGLNHHDIIHRMRDELEVMADGNADDKRRAFYILRDIHLPALARILKLE